MLAIKKKFSLLLTMAIVVVTCYGHQDHCQPITMPFCKGLQYNETIMPNLLGHLSQRQAESEVYRFSPIVEWGCSSKLKIFLCTVYAPVCTAVSRPLPPCRNLCLLARNDCEELMSMFYFIWPASLDCIRFPELNGKDMCIGEDDAQKSSVAIWQNGKVVGKPVNPSLDVTTPAVPSLDPTDLHIETMHQGRCEPIMIPLCKDLQYNETIMPNLLNHQTQDEAGLEVHQYFPLVKVQCSPQLQLLLCTVYAPPCTIIGHALPPCSNLCQSARRGCEELMNTFGIQWPDSLNCAKFPERDGQEMCIGEGDTEKLPMTIWQNGSIVATLHASHDVTAPVDRKDLHIVTTGQPVPVSSFRPLASNYTPCDPSCITLNFRTNNSHNLSCAILFFIACLLPGLGINLPSVHNFLL